MQAYNVFYAAIWLNADGSMGKTQLQDFLQEMLADPSINVSTRLAVEDYLYRMDAL
jgi:chloramphenicol 3-O-phosphotransferase